MSERIWCKYVVEWIATSPSANARLEAERNADEIKDRDQNGYEPNCASKDEDHQDYFADDGIHGLTLELSGGEAVRLERNVRPLARAYHGDLSQ
ncbi:hypothetical protein B0E51_18950 [Rhodanobacter sp. C05]|nr:hypothetical protein B0E51_18950 [Rhodanobacter sp. C05]